jgi:hypothetical protein
MKKMASILWTAAGMLGAEVMEKGRGLGFQLRKLLGVGDVIEGDLGAGGAELLTGHLNEGAVHGGIASEPFDKPVDEFTKEMVTGLGLHAFDLMACCDFAEKVAEGRLSAEERATAEQHFPTILAMVEGIFNPEPKEAA